MTRYEVLMEEWEIEMATREYDELELVDKDNPGGKAIYNAFKREFPEVTYTTWEDLHSDTRDSWRRIAKMGWKAIENREQ